MHMYMYFQESALEDSNVQSYNFAWLSYWGTLIK